MMSNIHPKCGKAFRGNKRKGETEIEVYHMWGTHIKACCAACENLDFGFTLHICT